MACLGTMPKNTRKKERCHGDTKENTGGRSHMRRHRHCRLGRRTNRCNGSGRQRWRGWSRNDGTGWHRNDRRNGVGSTRTTGPAGTTGGINSTLNNSLPGSNTPANNDIGRSGIGANSNIGSSTLGSNGIGSSVTGNMTGAQLAQNNIGPNSPAGTASSAAANTAIPAAPPWPVQVRFLAVAQRLARWNPPSRCCGRPPHRPSCRAD